MGNNKMHGILKMAGRKAKRAQIWDSELLATHIWSTFDLVGFKVIWGSVGAVVLKWPVSRKRLLVDRNSVKFGTREC